MKIRLLIFPVIMAAEVALVQAGAVGQHGQLARELGLSKAQKAQMKTIRQQARQTVQPIVERLKQNRQALATAVKAGDSGQIAALSKTQGELRGQTLTVRSQAKSQIYADLTDAQRQKMDEIQSHRKHDNVPPPPNPQIN